MGFLDFLTGGKKISCPTCGASGARKSGDTVRCPNASCSYYDPRLAGFGPLIDIPTTGDFRPARPLSIKYRNFQGVARDFTVDADSMERRKNHLVARAAPTGRRITLFRDRIQNLTEVESALPRISGSAIPEPTARERRVLSYHKHHGTSSPLYEEIKAKYPNWVGH